MAKTGKLVIYKFRESEVTAALNIPVTLQSIVKNFDFLK